MANIRPFRGLRPVPALAPQVATLPYDVMDSAEAKQMAAGNPYSFLRVTRSEITLPDHTDPYSSQVYEQAKTNLDQFIADGILMQDDNPCFYIYRQKMGSHEQIGLVAAASVDDYENDNIKKHELTRPDKEQDRVNHIHTTSAQTGAVFLTYQSSAAVNSLIARCMAKDPVYDFTSEDGISHTLYVVDRPDDVTALQQAFAAIDTLYVADGHHRSAAAARVRELRRQANPNHTGQEEYNFFLSVIFPHDMMYIMDYNRVVQDLNGLTAEEFMTQLNEHFTVEHRTAAVKPAASHTFGMYLAGQWYQLQAKAGSFDSKDVIGKLDVSILQCNVLSPLLGIGDPRTDKRIHFVGGIRGMQELERLVDSGRYQVAFSLFPTAIRELMDIADAGKIMPPKSTWFEPKLRDAMVVHRI